MPTYLKFALSLCAEVFLIILGGTLGVWLVARSIPADGGAPGDGIGVFMFGLAGMFIAGMIGIVALAIFWSVLAMRREAAARETGEAKSSAPEAEGVWPPPPSF